jgi:hypothetical protein
MTTRRLLTTLLLGALAEVTLLGIIVFLDEPQPIGGSPPHVRVESLALLLLPLLLAAAAAWAPLRLVARQRRRRPRA